MRKQSLFMIVIGFAAVAALLTGCAGTQKASDATFRTPEVTLSQAEVSSYFGYWFYDSKVQPSQPANAKPGNNGAPLIYSFVFNVKNPNDFPVLMDNMKFTVALDGFDLNTVGIPGSGLDSRREDEPGAGAVRFRHVGSVHEPRGGRRNGAAENGQEALGHARKMVDQGAGFLLPGGGEGRFGRVQGGRVDEGRAVQGKIPVIRMKRSN
jgi:hypothetical protein